MALTKERFSTRREGDRNSDPVAASAVIFAGALVALDASGNAVPGSVAATLTARGVAQATVDNSNGSAGDLQVETRKGVFRFNNSAGGDEITRADIGSTCYIVDDETVAKTDDESARSAAGVIEDLDADGVWVLIA